jgi:hypothetical protein
LVDLECGVLTPLSFFLFWSAAFCHRFCFSFVEIVPAKKGGGKVPHRKKRKTKESGVKTPHSKSTKYPCPGAWTSSIPARQVPASTS